MSRQLSIPAQNARRAELDALKRPLTHAEQTERDSLDNRLYCRVWRQKQRDAQRAPKARMAARASAGQRHHAA